MTAATITETAADLAAGRISATELTRASLAAIRARDPQTRAFVALTEQTAFIAAEAADRDFAAGRVRGPLQGIPLAVKDVLTTSDAPTRAGSRVPPTTWDKGIDATAVARLRDAGAVIIGKTATSEYACGLPDPLLGAAITRNPWDPERTASGSSTGTAVAVAAGYVLAGLGTDTAGSIRAPSSAVGVTGLKPTHGRVPTRGVVPLGPSVDTVGPIGRSARDCRVLLHAIAPPTRSAPARAEVDPRRLRVGLLRRGWLDDPDVSHESRASTLGVAEQMATAGAEIVEVTLPHRRDAWHANNIVWLREAYSLHAQSLRLHWADYGASARETLAAGGLIGAADYRDALRMRQVFGAAANELFETVDVLLTPYFASPVERVVDEDMTGLFSGTGFSAQWNLTGHPAIAFPSGVDRNGLPVASQFVGRHFDEATVLGAAECFQHLTSWHLRVPA